MLRRLLAGDTAGKPNTWRLTPLGKLIIGILTVAVLLAIVSQIRPDDGGVRQTVVAPPAPQSPETQRIFTTTDATDFTQLTYASYAAIVDNEIKAVPDAAKPPFDLARMLDRLELMRPKMSDSLYRRIQDGYKRAATVGAIGRDEIVCGNPDADGYKSYLKLGGREVAVVTVNTIRGDKLAESFEVTVHLRDKVLTEITCRP